MPEPVSDQIVTTPDDSPLDAKPGIEIGDQYIQDGKILGKYNSVEELFTDLANGTHQEPVVVPGSGADAPAAPGVGIPDADNPTPPAPGSFEIKPTEPGKFELSPEYVSLIEQEAAANKGVVPEARYKELAAAGIPKAFVDNYIEARIVSAVSENATIVTNLGGQGTIDQALGWAADNLPESEQASINAQLAKADHTGREMILRGLISRAGIIGQVGVGVSSQPSSVKPYATEEEWMRDISSSDYQNNVGDARAKCEARMKASPQLM